LHGTPELYDRKSQKKLCDLQEDALLTYADEVGDYLILHYKQADTDNYEYQYGKILNRNFETIANLPYLCDVIDGQLVFDYPSGCIGSCPIYDIDEIIIESQKGVFQ
jgi:hypothetical protein